MNARNCLRPVGPSLASSSFPSLPCGESKEDVVVNLGISRYVAGCRKRTLGSARWVACASGIPAEVENGWGWPGVGHEIPGKDEGRVPPGISDRSGPFGNGKGQGFGSLLPQVGMHVSVRAGGGLRKAGVKGKEFVHG